MHPVSFQRTCETPLGGAFAQHDSTVEEVFPKRTDSSLQSRVRLPNSNSPLRLSYHMHLAGVVFDNGDWRVCAAEYLVQVVLAWAQISDHLPNAEGFKPMLQLVNQKDGALFCQLSLHH